MWPSLLSLFNGSNHLLFFFLLPVAFDMGSSIGLAFSFALFLYYSLLGLTKVIWSKKQGIGWIVPQLFILSQPILIPFLLYHSFRLTYLSMLNNQSEKNELPWVLSFYKDFLAYSAPVFILIEGAATTIMIIISRHIVRAITYESQRAEVFLLTASIVTYLSSFYVLHVIYSIPGMDIITATLIGSVLTLTIVTTILMFITGDGIITDAALLFAYNVYCIYMLSNNWNRESKKSSNTILIDYDKLSLVTFQTFGLSITDSIYKINTKVLLKGVTDFIGSFKSISAIQKALSLRAFISLVYRTGVVSIAFYSVHEDDEEKSLISQTVLNFITAFTTPVLIAVYTHLLLSHYEYLSGDDSLWRWVGIGVCWVSYLYFVKNENED
ncbi:ER membrane protein [Gigaspora margarita]|uniref:ER membrane protein n=1 Tax=Gigaspora margarita TaxID=4874 RepID=A0A8H3WW81_GIGMA|nr:ER membrane protein [Gigaspora margarita]